MNYILFDHSPVRENLLPLTFTRPVCEIRTGILTIKEKWQKHFEGDFSYLTKEYLSDKYPLVKNSLNILINGAVMPDKQLTEVIKNLTTNQVLIQDKQIIAFCSKQIPDLDQLDQFIGKSDQINYTQDIFKIENLWDIFRCNDKAIEADFELLTAGRKSFELSNTNNIIAKEKIFIEEGAKAEFATINASTGPVYLGKNTEIMEGSVIRGPFAMCNNSLVKMSAKIYGPTTLGPHVKVGGEINNAVFTGYSNKAHDGFLGNAVIGEWCNLGADTNNSNLKNNYAHVKLWNYHAERFVNTGLQMCGLIMGDHSKCGINTMFNTGTVVGVNANIFGSGFPRNFIPSFSWGGAHGFTAFSINKAFEVAEKMMSRRNIDFNDIEKNILIKVFEMTDKYRKF